MFGCGLLGHSFRTPKVTAISSAIFIVRTSASIQYCLFLLCVLPFFQSCPQLTSFSPIIFSQSVSFRLADHFSTRHMFFCSFRVHPVDDSLNSHALFSAI